MRGRLPAVLLGLLLPALGVAAPGDLDPTFGNGGIVRDGDLGVDFVGGLALAPDGRLIVAASRSGFQGDGVLYLVSYTPDGRRDPGFGTGGVVTVPGDLDPGVAVDADGSVLVASTHCDPTNCVGRLARYGADGRLAPTFVAPDRSLFPPTMPEVVARQPDGRILVGGNNGHAPGFGVWLARYEADGTNDASFGTGGVASRGDVSPHGASLDSFVVRSDGSILAGVTGGTGEGVFGAIERFGPSGTDEGPSSTPFGYPLLAPVPGGGVIVVGTIFSDPNPGQIVLARYDDALNQDTSFGGAGPMATAHDMLLEPDGDVVVAGSGAVSGGFLVLRFTDAGVLDASFGQGGIATVAPDPAVAYRVARQSDGRLLAAGTIGGTVAVARIVEDTAVTTTTTAPGMTTTTASTASTTSTTTPPAGTPTGHTPGTAPTPTPCATADCACVTATACAGTLPVVGARLARACTLISRAGATEVRPRRLLRHAVRLLRADRRAMKRMRAVDAQCRATLTSEIEALADRARSLLGALP